MASKAGYEPIPDVEKGEGAVGADKNTVDRGANVQEKYQELNEKETELLLLLDQTIDEGAAFHFSIPTVTPEELDFEAKGICYYAFAPTVTALCTLVAAFCLEKYAQVSDGAYTALAEWGIVFFPYINAVIVFLSTVAPIQERLMRAIQPVFTQTEVARETVDSTIDEIPVKVDQRLDQIKVLMSEVLKPLKPTLEKATKHSDQIQKIYPSFLDVPTPTEIEHDVDEAKGMVDGKVDEARKHVVIEDYIPRYMRSARSFYWRVVFPIFAVALLVQLVVAFLSTFAAQLVEGDAASGTPAFRFLRELTQETTQNTFEQFEEETGEAFQQFKEEAGEAVGQFEEDAGEALEEFESAFVGEMKGLAIAVLLSYLTALLEMLCIYLLTNPKVHAMLVNAAMDRVALEADRTLRQHGVSDQVVDVLETRVTMIRKKTLKLLRAKRGIDDALSKVGGLEAVAGAMDVIASLDSPFKSDEKAPNGDDEKDESRRRGSPLKQFRRLLGKKK